MLGLRDPGQDGFLQMGEVLRLRLDADLVVLSACRTAQGEEIAGEGIVGLFGAFLEAGSRRVLASLWGVQDRSTAAWMARFYRHIQEGRSAAAVAATKLDMLDGRIKAPDGQNWSHPFHWAPFVLVGCN